MNRKAVASELVKLAKELTAKNMYVSVRLDGGSLTVKRIPIPNNIARDLKKRNEFAIEYLRDLGYKKVEIDEWN